jgi:hypothetical protein
MKDKPTPVTDAEGKPMRGKWAQGIVPRHFRWVLTDRLAICERPGGHGQSHRRVRRQEEIIWLRQNGFDCVISLIPSSHNLHNYDELGMPFLHRPVEKRSAMGARLPQIYDEIMAMLDEGQRLVVHSDAVDDTVLGFVGGYLVWTGLVPGVPETVTVVERMLERQLGPDARAMVAAVYEARRE